MTLEKSIIGDLCQVEVFVSLERNGVHKSHLCDSILPVEKCKKNNATEDMVLYLDSF